MKYSYNTLDFGLGILGTRPYVGEEHTRARPFSCRNHDSLQGSREETTHTCTFNHRVPSSKESTACEWMIVGPDEDGATVKYEGISKSINRAVRRV